MEPNALPPQVTRVIERLRRARRWLLLVLGLVAVALVPWIGYLSATLPSEHVVHHWQIAWVGLDLAEAAALVATFVALLRESPAVTVLASIAGTLLVCDAWFDVVTSRGAGAIALAMTEALGIELPLALLCSWVAQTSRPRQPLTTTHTDQQGALQ